LAPEPLLPGRLGEPRPEALPSFGRDGVDEAVRLALLALEAPLDQLPGRQAGEDGIDLPVALAPEVGHAALDPLLEVVARSRAQGQHPQHRVLGRARLACHISIRYTSTIYSQGAAHVC